MSPPIKLVHPRAQGQWPKLYDAADLHQTPAGVLVLIAVVNTPPVASLCVKRQPTKRVFLISFCLEWSEHNLRVNEVSVV